MITEIEKYIFEESLFRIDQLLNYQRTEKNEFSSVPPFNKLPLKGGVLADCSVLHMKLKVSSSNSHDQLVVHRAFISEAVAILSSDSNCVDMNMIGTRLIAIFNTPFKRNIEAMVDKAAMINTLVQIISKKAKNLSLPTISLLIGMDYGQAMIMRFGSFNVGEVSPRAIVWSGDPVEGAMQLLETSVIDNNNIRISTSVYQNLNPEYTKFFVPSIQRNYYGANIVNTFMKDWLNMQ